MFVTVEPLTSFQVNLYIYNLGQCSHVHLLSSHSD